MIFQKLRSGIEIVTLLVIGAMALLETWLVGIKSLKRKPWIIFLLLSVLISLIDVTIDLAKHEADQVLGLQSFLALFKATGTPLTHPSSVAAARLKIRESKN